MRGCVGVGGDRCRDVSVGECVGIWVSVWVCG